VSCRSAAEDARWPKSKTDLRSNKADRIVPQVPGALSRRSNLLAIAPPHFRAL
jgi:hypothetical protein